MTDHAIASRTALLGANLAGIRARISSALGRAPDCRREVTVVVVTKYVDAGVIPLLAACGVRDVGENRADALVAKVGAPAGLRWHFIGHLQRNKARRVVERIHALHSVDSLRLARHVEEILAGLGRTLSAYVQVNLSGERAKHGLDPERIPEFLEGAGALRYLRLDGWMTMAAHEDDPERARPTFRRLRQLRDEFAGRLGAAHPLDRLSMGMSGDFEVAVEEGADVVRVGTAVYEGLW